MRARDNRIDKLRRTITAAPVRPYVLKEAYEFFTMFGELPDEDNVADAVLRKALQNGKADVPESSYGTLEDALCRITLLATEFDTKGKSLVTGPDVREPLFCEAMDENPYTRQIARAAIAVEVAHGGNVEDPAFAARHGLPKHNSVSMHVLGYPQKWVRPPYEEQAARLFARQDAMRERIPMPTADPSWFDLQADATLEFYKTGALPDDELRREALLAHLEMDAIIAHKKGRDVAELMALLDKVAWKEGEEREEALKLVCAMAAEGRIP